MKNNKVTIQDIANALHLSRITVSKVLNNSPNVSADTRELVLQKAIEMNYQPAGQTQTGLLHPGKTLHTKSFAFVMHATPDAFHISSPIITQFQQELRKKNYPLTLHTITPSDIDFMALPPNLNAEQVEAIICMEMFHPEYTKLLCSLGVPVLLIDACADFYSQNLPCDLLMMENHTSAYQMLTTLCRRHNLSTMGFVGDKDHCLSFRERYEGLVLAAAAYGVATEPYHIIADDRFYSQDGWMKEQLRHLPKLPELFFCANDALAQVLAQSLHTLGYQIPRDIMVCGFDGISSLNPFINTLTTVRIPATELGCYAANLIFARLAAPERIPSATYLRTEICFRESAQ